MKKIIYLIIGVLLLFLVLGGVLVVIEDKPKDAWIDVLMIIVFSTLSILCFLRSYRLHKMHSITKTKNNGTKAFDIVIKITKHQTLFSFH